MHERFPNPVEDQGLEMGECGFQRGKRLGAHVPLRGIAAQGLLDAHGAMEVAPGSHFNEETGRVAQQGGIGVERDRIVFHGFLMRHVTPVFKG